MKISVHRKKSELSSKKIQRDMEEKNIYLGKYNKKFHKLKKFDYG